MALNIPQSNDLQIVGTSGGMQTLPSQYVKTFQRWSIQHNDEQEEDDNSFDCNDILTGLKGSAVQAPGFINPTSISELWWPTDIAKIQVRPTLDVILKSGYPAYASGGMDVRVPPEASADGQEWRNYGMNSQPMARQWTTFGFAVELGFRVEIFLGEGDNLEDPQWQKLGTTNAVQDVELTQKAVEQIGIFLSELDEDSPLSRGFHVVSIPTSTEWVDLPQLPVVETKETELENPGYALISLATAEPSSTELLALDNDLVAMSATSVMSVFVSRSAAGGDSEFLPDAYRPLYE